LTENGGTPHQELSKNGESHKLGDAQGTALNLLNSRFANLYTLFFEQHKMIVETWRVFI
jgi:hypothetical protein